MTDKKPSVVTATTKLTKEQEQVLFIVQENKYTSDELETIFEYLNKLNLCDFVYSLDVHILHYLSNADAIADENLTGLYNLSAFNRALSEIAGKM